MPGDLPAGRPAWPVLLLHAVVVAALAWPIAHVAFPLLTDYPNHLARLYILDALPGSPELQRYYLVKPGLYPYQAMNLVVQPLAPLIGLERAGRVFVALALVLPYLGTLALARALDGRLTVWPMLAALYCYNYDFAFGFLTYTFTIGVALAVLAGWVVTAAWRPLPRLALFTLATAAILLCHVLVVGFYGLMLVGWELGRPGFRLRQLGPALLPFVPAALLLLLVPGADLGPRETIWGSLPDHLVALLAPVSFSKTPWETGLFLLTGLALVAGLLGRQLALDLRLRWSLAALGLLSLAMPYALAGVQLMGYRLPVLFALLLVAACRPRAGPRLSWGFAALAALVLAARLADVDRRLQAADRQVAAFRSAARMIPVGARIMPAMIAEDPGRMPLWPINYLQLEALLVIDRQVFYPMLFRMYEVGITPAYRDRSQARGLPPRLDLLTGDGAWPGWRQQFDYLLLFHFGAPPAVPPAGLSPVAAGDFFAIYRIGDAG